MPTCRRYFPVLSRDLGTYFRRDRPIRPLFWLRSCPQTIFTRFVWQRERDPGIRLGGPSFQKIKQPLRNALVFAANSPRLCNAQISLTLLCDAVYAISAGRDPLAHPFIHPVWEGFHMVRVEDIQQYGKEHLDTVVASATTLQNGIQTIATAYGDYTKKSFEDTRSYVEKLSGVKSLDKAIEVQTEFAKSAYETFVAESQKIAGLYTDLAKQTFKPLEGIVAKLTPAAA